jgi:hypothetical protein
VAISTPVNAWLTRRPWVSEDPTNGPRPRAVAQTTTAAMNRPAVAAPTWRNRTAAQARAGKTRKVPAAGTASATTASSASAAASAPASNTRVSLGRWFQRRVEHSSSGGATVRMPAMSPAHQMTHADGSDPTASVPLAHRLVTPMLALIVVLTGAASPASARTSRTRSSPTPKSARRSSHAPASASKVLPSAIAALTHSGTDVEALNSSAPSATPGTARRPSSRTAARAIPLGGQMGAMLVWTKASANAALAPATYTPASSTVTPRSAAPDRPARTGRIPCNRAGSPAISPPQANRPEPPGCTRPRPMPKKERFCRHHLESARASRWKEA